MTVGGATFLYQISPGFIINLLLSFLRRKRGRNYHDHSFPRPAGVHVPTGFQIKSPAVCFILIKAVLRLDFSVGLIDLLMNLSSWRKNVIRFNANKTQLSIYK